MTNCAGGCDDYGELQEKVEKYEFLLRALVVENDPRDEGDSKVYCTYCGNPARGRDWFVFINIIHTATCPYALARIAIGEPVKVEEEK